MPPSSRCNNFAFLKDISVLNFEDVELSVFLNNLMSLFAGCQTQCLKKFVCQCIQRDTILLLISILYVSECFYTVLEITDAISVL